MLAAVGGASFRQARLHGGGGTALAAGRGRNWTLGGVARQARDIVLKWLLRENARPVLDLLGLRDVATVLGPAPTALADVTVRGHVLDYLLALEDGTYLHLEPQSHPADLDRLLVYDALLYRQDHRRIRTVVVYAGPVRQAADTLDAGCARYRVENVYLGALDGDAVLADLGAKVAAGEALTRDDVVRLAFVPLMGLRQKSIAAAATEALRLARGIGEAAERRGCLAAIVGLASRVLDEAEAATLLRGVHEMPDLLAELLSEGMQKGLEKGLEKGLKKGRHEGRAEGLAESILLAVRMRLGGVPSALEQRVRAERRPEVLEVWLKAALAAPSPEALLAAMGPE